MTTTTWGGRREGAGRPEGPGNRLLRIQATEAEYREILEALNTRQRTEALLDAAAVQRMKGEDDGYLG